MPVAPSGAAHLWKGALSLFRRHAPRSPGVALAVIVALMLGVTVLRWFVDGTGQAAALLYVVPIALAAVRFGRSGGLAAASFAIAAFVVLEFVRAHGDVDVTGWVGPLLAMGLMGALVGHLSESVTRNELARKLGEWRLEDSLDAGKAASEASDSIVQQVAAARWMLEAGRNEEALSMLSATVADGITQVSGTMSPLAAGAIPEPPPSEPGETASPLDAPRPGPTLDTGHAAVERRDRP